MNRRTMLRVGIIIALLSIIIFSQTVRAQSVSELFISEYIEGSSNNKALEFYNGTGAAINLATEGYKVEYYFNGSATVGLTIALTGTVADGDVFVLAHSSANAAILAQADQTNGSGWFNGDDAIVLKKGSVIIDSIGQVGFDPGTEWSGGGMGTADETLRRQATVCQGDPITTDAFNPSLEWASFAIDNSADLGSHTINCGAPVDNPPTVQSTSPSNGAVNVTANTNLTITFSESVNVTGAWYAISCGSSGSHTAVATPASPAASYTLNPDVDFSSGETCTVTIYASQVSDVDGVANNMAANYIFSFQVVSLTNVCGDPATAIHAIQGSGTASPLAGSSRTVEGVVVGDFQASTELNGFYLQEENADADTDPATSEGIFVYAPGGTAVNPGDRVRLTGTISEYQDLTEMSGISNLQICASGVSVTPTAVSLPIASVATWEQYEGMLVTIGGPLYVTEHYLLGRYGQVSLSVNGRLDQPTGVAAPGAPAADVQALNNRSRILLDDYRTTQNPDPILHPAPGLSAANTLRGGDTLPNLTGVVDNFNTGSVSEYRIQPVAAVNFTQANPRSATPPNVGGTLQVASFNVLNYFNGNGLGGGFPTSRGANSLEEFNRQRAKIVAAINGLNADVIGLMEIENDGYGTNSAIQDLVNGLNAAAGPGTYAFINPGVSPLGSDQIAVGLLYRVSAVTPSGSPAVLTSAVDPDFDDTRNRPALAQTFQEIATGEQFTVVVNHLKSKGSECTGDPDLGDGQGNCNQTRTDAATALANWLTTNPTGVNDADYLIIGDLNSYAQEDPITALRNAGYVDLLSFGSQPYSYVFDGQWGYLDYALSSAALTGQITGAAPWRINADEPLALDYNLEFKSAGQQISLYNADAYRASDHNPVLVGLALGQTTDWGDLASSYGLAWHTGSGQIRLGTAWTADSGPALNSDSASDDGIRMGAGSGPAGQWQPGVNGGSLDITVTGAGNGCLYGWIDWNEDGRFADPSERVIDAQTGGSGNYAFTVPADEFLPPGTPTDASNQVYNVRVRLYGACSSGPTGPGEGGEVEDYTVTFTPTAVSLTSLSGRTVTPWLALALLGLIGLGFIGIVWRRYGR